MHFISWYKALHSTDAEDFSALCEPEKKRHLGTNVFNYIEIIKKQIGAPIETVLWAVGRAAPA